MATLNSITELLRDIEENIATLIGQELKFNEYINNLSSQIGKLRTNLTQEQQSSLPKVSLKELPSYNPQQIPLLSIAETCEYVINRNRILRNNQNNLSDLFLKLKKVSRISIKEYIMKCNKERINCYDDINKKLQIILGNINKQEGQATIFQKGYLLYDLVHNNTMEQFTELLKNKDKIYNTVVNEPRPQSGGAPSTLLQVIGLTKIKAIIEFMNNTNKTNFNITNVTNTNDLINNDDIINIIAKFFYEQPIMLQQPDKN